METKTTTTISEYLGGPCQRAVLLIQQAETYSLYLELEADYQGGYNVTARYQNIRNPDNCYYLGAFYRLAARDAWRAYRILRSRFYRGLYVMEREYKKIGLYYHTWFHYRKP